MVSIRKNKRRIHRKIFKGLVSDQVIFMTAFGDQLLKELDGARSEDDIRAAIARMKTDGRLEVQGEYILLKV